MRKSKLSAVSLAVSIGLMGCGSSSQPPIDSVSGTGAGGAVAGSGGSTGATASGGSSVTGGTATGWGTGGMGGNPMGGVGGNPTGGIGDVPTTGATGGAPTTGGMGGNPTGGVGGNPTGGVGGNPTGGMGGSPTGGVGGNPTGGMGGSPTGGVGGNPTGGAATGGAATGGAATGGAATGGAATGGSSGGSGVDPCTVTAMPTGGQQHSGNGRGGSDNLAWEIWSNQGSGTLTSFSTPAFTAGWNNSGNYLGRLGFEWGNAGKTYDAYGTITAEFNEIKSGSSGGKWSYMGMYGWTNNPCIEWYIIEDSFSAMPFNPGSCPAMSNSPMIIDGGEYILCTRNTSGTGGDRCGGAGSWNQYYSIRKTARTCGTISVTEHFNAWAAAGSQLGKLLEVKVLVEVGGGAGTVDYPLAKVTTTQ